MSESFFFTSDLPEPEIPVVTLTDFVFSNVQDHGDRDLLVDQSGRKYNGAQLLGMVHKVAKGLQEAGMKKGDVLCLYSPNVPEYAVVFHAVASLGAIVTTASPLLTPDELTTQLRDSGATSLVTVSMFADKAAQAAEAAGAIAHRYVFDEAEGWTPLKALLANDGAFQRPEIDPLTDVVALPYSSGTTGKAKGVMLTHHNLVSNCVQIAAVENSLTPEDVFIGVLPFYHIYALVLILNFALWKGAKVVVMPKFDPVKYLELAQQHKATYLHIVPPIVLFLAKHPVVAKFDLSSVKCIFSGAAPLGEEVEAAVRARLGAEVKQAYGMTELSPAVTVTPMEKVKTGSSGVLLPHQKAKIVDVDTDEVVTECGKRGELRIKGPNVMKGYLNRDDATADTIDSEGFLRTGDICYRDEEGYYFIVDRLKELVKYKGYQVPPAELEDLLQGHPDVADAAVVGKPDQEAGELPKAYIVLKEGAEATEEAIQAWVAERVAPHKKLRGGVEFTKEIPKSLSGKILRRVLKEKERAAAAAASQIEGKDVAEKAAGVLGAQ